jgi:FkbM family methyltransferase
LPYNLWKHLPQSQYIDVIDVGAHDGAFINKLSRFRKIRRGLLIEPIPSKALKLRQNFPGPVYTVLECVLADRSGTLALELNEALETSSVLSIRKDLNELSQVGVGKAQAIVCEAQTLDSAVELSGLDRINLLKIDVQGFEDRVLMGGQAALSKTDLIWTEVSLVRLYEHSCLFSDIHSLLRGQGFSLLEIEPGFRGPDGELLQADALFKRK